ncbi:MAG: hypothetical protein ACREA0_05260, partial [bacterium]
LSEHDSYASSWREYLPRYGLLAVAIPPYSEGSRLSLIADYAGWLTSAAEQGVAQGQYRVGQLYAKGQGVPKDMEITYAWFGVAAHLGNTQAATEKKTAASALSSEALRKAQSLSTDYIDRYAKPPGERK